MLRNPIVAVVVGVAMIALSFIVHGDTRDLILRIVGVLAILAGVFMVVTGRRG